MFLVEHFRKKDGEMAELGDAGVLNTPDVNRASSSLVFVTTFDSID